MKLLLLLLLLLLVALTFSFISCEENELVGLQPDKVIGE